MPKQREVVNISYNDVGFDKGHVKSFATPEEFIEATESHIFEGESNRKEMLTDVWNLAQESPKKLEKLQEQAESTDLKPVVDDQKAAEKEDESSSGKKASRK